MRVGRVVINADTECWAFDRNVQRTKRGESVTIAMSGGCIDTIHGIADPRYILKSIVGFIIATSLDIEDLAFLVVENGWIVEDAIELQQFVDMLS